MSTGIVTGREYLKTRVRGYADWRPRKATMVVIEWVKAVIAEYRIALTIRQIFYRLVGKHGFEKTEQSYECLIEYLNRARRAGVIGWDAVRDDTENVPDVPGWYSPKHFWINVEAQAQDYFHTPDGDRYVEVWVETAGMAPQIQAIADLFGVRVVASGGFSSTTARRNAAIRLSDVDIPVRVLLIGDYDPSGQSIMDSAAEDILAFGANVEFEKR